MSSEKASPKSTSHSERGPKILNISLKAARYISPPSVTANTKCQINFYLDRSYSLVCRGKPNAKLISILYHFVELDSKAHPLASTSPLASQDLNNLVLSSGNSRSSASSSDSESLIQPKRLRSRHEKTGAGSPKPSTSKPRSSKSPSSDPKKSRAKVSGKGSFSKASSGCSDTELLTDPSFRAGPDKRKPPVSSGSSSDGSTGKGKKGPSPSKTKKSPTKGSGSESNSSPQPGTSVSFLESSQPRVATHWDTERIPVGVIYERAGKLLQKHKNQQRHLTIDYRVRLCLEDFVDQAEEELANECLAFEYHLAERTPQANRLRGVDSAFLTRPYKHKRDSKKVVRLISELNEIRTANYQTNYDSCLDYYWDLNSRGHLIYSDDYILDEETSYVPAVYRQKALALDIALVDELQFDQQIRDEQQAADSALSQALN